MPSPAVGSRPPRLTPAVAGPAVAHGGGTGAALPAALAPLGCVTLAELLDETSELVCVTGPEGRITYVNRAWQRALGYSAAEAAAMPAVDFVAPEQRAAYRAAARRLVAGHTVDGFEAVLVARDGRRVVCRGRAAPQMERGPDGTARCLGTRAFYRDVTAERQTEAVRARLAATLEASPDYVALQTRDGGFVYLNRAGRQLVGLAEDASLDVLHAADLHPAVEQARFADEILPAAMRDGRWVGESALLAAGGEVVPVELTVIAHPSTREADRTPYFVSTVARDLRVRQRAERERLELSTAVAMSPDGVSLTAADGTFTYVNAAHTAAFGYTLDELAGREWDVCYEPAEAARLRGLEGPALRATGRWFGEAVGRRRDGTRFPHELQLVRMPWGGLVCSVRDISERRAAERALEDQLIRDELTGLLNRRGFFAHAADALAAAARDGRRCALLYGDVDRFKQLNDAHGHAVGDEGLRLAAAALRSAATPGDVVARLAGDEFVALLVDATPARVERARERLRRALVENAVPTADAALAAARDAAPGVAPGAAAPGAFVTMSLGAALQTAPADPGRADDELERLLREADAALYAEKRARR